MQGDLPVTRIIEVIQEEMGSMTRRSSVGTELHRGAGAFPLGLRRRSMEKPDFQVIVKPPVTWNAPLTHYCRIE